MALRVFLAYLEGLKMALMASLLRKLRVENGRGNQANCHRNHWPQFPPGINTREEPVKRPSRGEVRLPSHLAGNTGPKSLRDLNTQVGSNIRNYSRVVFRINQYREDTAKKKTG